MLGVQKSNKATNLLLEGLFTLWILKSSQGLVKYVIGCCTRLETTLIYTKERKKIVRVTMKFEVSKDIF